MTAQRGRNPVAALHHLARDLRITGLIGADQPKLSQAIEIKKGAEPGEQKDVGTRASGHWKLFEAYRRMIEDLKAPRSPRASKRRFNNQRSTIHLIVRKAHV